MSSCRPRKADGKHGKQEGVKTGKTSRQRGLKADGKAFTADANRVAAVVRCLGFSHFGPR